MIKNSVPQDIAPACCIVCQKKMPEQPVTTQWIYLAGATPIGAMVCSKGCLSIAVARHKTSGRVDIAEMRIN
jgi:hypothetical protein